MKKTKFEVTGMTCSACSAHIEKAVSKVDGVNSVNVQLMNNSMVVEYDDKITNIDKIGNVVVKAGYNSKAYENKSNQKISSKKNLDNDLVNMRFRLIVSFVFMLVLMYVAMGDMIGLPVPWFFIGTENAVIFAFAQLLLASPVMIVNRKYFIAGFKNLFRLHPNMDSLIAVGSGASFVYGVIAIFLMSYGQNHGDMDMVHMFMHDLYFESAAMILALVTLGKYLETRSKGKTHEAIEKLINMSPKTAIKLVDGIEVEVDIKDVRVGDIVLVKPGMMVPVDGDVVEGFTSVDESALTGESIPVEKMKGSGVMTASINGNGAIQIVTTKASEDSTLSQIIKLVEEASNSKAPISKLADKISLVFVPIVMAISLLSFIMWLTVGNVTASYALSIAIAVLVISCPCALGLATPVAIMVGTGTGAQNGILIKSGEALQTAHNVTVVVLDKTGTITQGKPIVTDVIPLNGEDEFALMNIAVSLEKYSEHPLATAIVSHAEQNNIAGQAIQDFESIPGQGVRALIDGVECYAGNKRLLINIGVDIEWAESQANKLALQGKTPLFFVKDNKIIGLVAVSDTVKPSSRQAIGQLKSMNIRVIMLTGDNRLTAEAVGNEVGADSVIAEVLPQGKEAVIRDIQSKGEIVAMVGDGVNDAPALARADVGIAIGAGMDVAIESADIVLMKSDLIDVANAIKLSKKVMNNIKGNLFWAFIYNIIGIPLAAGVLVPWLGVKLNPMIAAAAMSLSSVSVVLNALRLKLFKPYTTAPINELDANNSIADENEINEIENKVNTMQSEDSAVMGVESNENYIKNVVIEGMMCDHCSGKVKEAFNNVDNWNTDVDLGAKTATISSCVTISETKVTEIIELLGYKVISIK